MSTHKEYNEDYPETPEEIRAEYQSLMEELSDVLEGGDVKIDFEDIPRFSAVIGIIHGIIRNELDTLRENSIIESFLADKKTGLLHDLPAFRPIQTQLYHRPMQTQLYQSIAKEHMESNTKETITDGEWEAFIDRFQDNFAEEVSSLAVDYWNERASYGFEYSEEEE